MHKTIVLNTLLLISFYFNINVSGQVKENYKPVPLSKVFYRLGPDLAGSITKNYGLNHIVGIAGSYGMVKSGIDWEWYKIARDNKAVPKAGLPSVILGGTLPFVVPVTLIVHGRNRENTDLQYTGLALIQAELIASAITSTYKFFTGRVPPELLGDENQKREDFSRDFRFGINRGGIFHGWPSGHTMTAFAMATTLVTLYPDNTAVKIGAMSYAYFIGIGISTNIHWLSDAFAGALMGYAIGKTVGKSFRSLMDANNYSEPRTSLYISPMQVGLCYRF